jgi:hypothetical protein
MPDATTFAELFGGVFPTEAQVEEAVVYGPLGDDLTGTLRSETASQAEILAAIAAIGNTIVLPAVGISADRSPGITLNAFVGETIETAITLYQTDGVTPVVLTGKTLAIPFEARQGVDVATVASNDITIGGPSDNVVTFSMPSAVTALERTLRFAIRDVAAPKTVYLQGILSVRRAAQVDA